MPTSQNGYSANDRSVIAQYTVPGTQLKIALRRGDVSVVLLEYLRRYHLEVESLVHTPQDLWGYAERTIRGSSTELSNHASGTAADARATRHPLGVRRTFTAKEIAALDNLLAWFEGVLRHGKDYSGRVDEMHVEINKGAAEVKRIADKVRAGPAQPPPPPEEDDDMPAVTLNLPAGIGQRQPIIVPPFAVFSPDDPRAARFWMCTGWENAEIRGGYFIRDRGPGLSPQQEAWGGTGAFPLVKDDRPAWVLPEGCTQVSLEYDSPHPLSVMITYKSPF